MNRIVLGWVVMLVLTGGLIGCAPAEESSPEGDAVEAVQTALPDTIRQAVEIARAIEADPDRAEEILSEAGLTIEQYEQRIYEIAADPELSRLYNEALAN